MNPLIQVKTKTSAIANLMNGSFLRVVVLGAVLILVGAPAMAHAFTFTTIDVPGATSTEAFDVNQRGQIVGHYLDTSGADHGFMLYRGIFTTIDVPSAIGTVVDGINAEGQIVGGYFDTNGTTIDVPAATETFVRQIGE